MSRRDDDRVFWWLVAAVFVLPLLAPKPKPKPEPFKGGGGGFGGGGASGSW